jgi:hypothetical protein
VRTRTTSEPRWTEQDRAEVLALGEYRDSLCPLCGRPLEVCTSHEETGPQFRARIRSVCRVTLAKLERQSAMTEGGRKPMPKNAPAYLWAVDESG